MFFLWHSNGPKGCVMITVTVIIALSPVSHGRDVFHYFIIAISVVVTLLAFFVIVISSLLLLLLLL